MVTVNSADEIRAWPLSEFGWHIAPTGEHIKLGNDVKLGNGVTSGALNQQFREMYHGDVIFTKWVTPDRKSPNFGGNGTVIEYPVGAVIECPEAETTDKQCDVGLHVFRRGYRPEWAGLCGAEHDYIAIDVLVQCPDDICFGGLPGNDAKLRVRKLKVLT